MALSNDQLSAITEKFYLKKLYDNIFDSNPYLQRILKKDAYQSVNGGTQISVPLNYAQTTASGWYSGADTLDTSDNENITSALYSWTNAYANISITKSDEAKNGGDRGVISLLKSKMQIAEKTLKDILGTGLFSNGSNTKSIVGLRDIVAQDQTVGGIDQASYSWWQSQLDSTTTTLTISKMQTLFNNAAVDSEMPTLGLTTRTVYNIYYAMLQPQQRFMDDQTAKGGFSSLMFNGIPIISDSHCPASHLFFLNENHLKLWYHPSQNFSLEPFQKPVNQEVRVARVLWMGAFGSTNNRLHGAFTGITA